jgi:hypothetical protein
VAPEDHDVEQDVEPHAQAPLNLPPPPLVPVGPARDWDEDEANERGDDSAGSEAAD